MRYPRLFWASILPVAIASTFVVKKLTPLISPPLVTRQEIQDAFLDGLSRACAPEPDELVAYVLAVLTPVVLMYGMVSLLRLRLESFERRRVTLGLIAFVAQAAVMLFAAKAWLYEAAHSWSGQLKDYAPAQLALTACLATLLTYRWLSSAAKVQVLTIWERVSRARVLPSLLAASWTVAHLLGCVFTDDNIRRAAGTISYHLPFTMGEFAAVVNGRFPLVDFYSQYQNLLGHLLHPFFAVVGLSVTTFTLAMGILSGIGFLLLYRVLWRVSGSPWLGLALYVPVVAVSLAEAETAGVNPSNAFNYYAVGPIRYFGHFFAAYLALAYLQVPKVRRLLVVSCAAALVGLNNLDFGVPAALGVLACAILFPPDSLHASRWVRSLAATLVFVIGASLTLMAFALSAKLATGSWPDPGILTEYQRTFAYLGFNMVRLPPNGMYWIMYITYMLALLYAVFDGYSRDSNHVSRARRLSVGMLAYAGISGFGVGMYFVGRSHPAVIIAMYPAWAFALALLLQRIVADVYRQRTWRADEGAVIHAIPSAAILGVWAGLVPLILELPQVSAEIDRLEYHSGGLDPRPTRLSALISKYVPKGAPTVVVAVNAHQLATDASVENLYPFAHPGSVLLKSQLRPVLDSITRLPSGDQYVFGSVWPQVAEALGQSGFKQIDSDGDFIVWHATK